MKISVILPLFLFLALNTILISAVIIVDKTRPKKGYVTNDNESTKLRVKLRSTFDIRAVIFILKDPIGNVSVEVGKPNGGGKYKTTTKLELEGKWQWQAVIVNSKLSQKTTPWREITVVSTQPSTAVSPKPSSSPISSPLSLSPSPTVPREPPKVTEATNDIRTLLSTDQLLAPKFVRLGFHMCVGGCDGCVS